MAARPLPFLFLTALLGAQAPEPAIATAVVQPPARVAPEAAPAISAKLMDAPPELLAYTTRAMAGHMTDRAKLQALVSAIFRKPDDGGLGISYSNDHTRTISEVWQDRKANCISLTALTVAACRAAGMDARFADSYEVGVWKRVGNMIRYERHVVAVIDATSGDALVADFVPQVRENYRFFSLLSEQRVVALYHSNRAVEHLQDGDKAAALEDAHRSVDGDPTSAIGWNVLGVVQRSMGQGAEAEDSFLQALKVDPKDGAACGNLESLCLEQKRVAEADRYRSLGLELRKKDPYFNAFLATEAMEAGNLEEAYSRLRTAIRLMPHEPEFYVQLAGLQVSRGERKDAIKSLELAKRWALPEVKDRLDTKLALLQKNI